MSRGRIDRHQASSNSLRKLLSIGILPAELRLKIWSCATEPRIVILDDLLGKYRSYPLPSVTQLNSEARIESRAGYEAVCHGSHIHFGRDIFVCDSSLSEQTSNRPLELIATRIQRLAFYDCFPDESQVDEPCRYSAYLATRSLPDSHSRIEFDRLWFPNLNELWVIKVGEVKRSWMVGTNRNLPFDAWFKKSARHFRYWTESDIVEIAPLDLNDSDTKAVLHQGRCGKVDCHDLNRGRPRLAIKVTFLDGKYTDGAQHNDWQRIMPWASADEKITPEDTKENRMIWMIVERALTFSLRWDWAAESAMGNPELRRTRPGHIAQRIG